MVLRLHFSLRELVLNLERELAASDAVAEVFAGIGRERAEIDIPGVGIKIHKEIFSERVNLASDVDRRGVVELGLDCQIAWGLRLQLRDRSLHGGEVGRIIRLDEEIAEVDVASSQVDLADGDAPRAGRGRCVSLVWRCGRRCRLRWLFFFGGQVLQIEFAVGANEDARVEIGEIDFVDSQLQWRHSPLEAAKIQRLPLEQILSSVSVDGGEIRNLEAALIADLQRALAAGF